MRRARAPSRRIFFSGSSLTGCKTQKALIKDANDSKCHLHVSARLLRFKTRVRRPDFPMLDTRRSRAARALLSNDADIECTER